MREKIADFLNTPIGIFDLWHLVHFTSGFLLMRYFLKNSKNKFIYLFGLLVAYELFELYFIGIGSDLFRVESKLNIFLDILVGMVGGWLAIKFK